MSDAGGEYTSKAFNNMLTERGITIVAAQKIYFFLSVMGATFLIVPG
jgi:hypothetical protein